ncbi:MAG: hypothetical protein WCI51_17975 [Lentisphaerota bacterium]
MNVKKLGIWIDHKEAFLVSLQGDQTAVAHIESNADSHYKPSGGWKASGTSVAQSVSKEQTAGERLKHQLHQYYQQIVTEADKVNRVYICGPGAAKTELEKEMAKAKSQHAKVEAVETCDKMTEKQIVAKVKSFFHIPVRQS